MEARDLHGPEKATDDDKMLRIITLCVTISSRDLTNLSHTVLLSIFPIYSFIFIQAYSSLVSSFVIILHLRSNTLRKPLVTDPPVRSMASITPKYEIITYHFQN